MGSLVPLILTYTHVEIGCFDRLLSHNSEKGTEHITVKNTWTNVQNIFLKKDGEYGN